MTRKTAETFFTRSLLGIEYHHRLDLAPTQALLDRSRKQRGMWEEYERDFLALIRNRAIETLPKQMFDGACLLCSEDSSDHCHRRLVAEYLRDPWGDLQIIHLQRPRSPRVAFLCPLGDLCAPVLQPPAVDSTVDPLWNRPAPPA